MKEKEKNTYHWPKRRVSMFKPRYPSFAISSFLDGVS